MNPDLESSSGGYKLAKLETKTHQMAYCALESINCNKMMDPKAKKQRMASCSVGSMKEQNLEKASEFLAQVKQTDLYHRFIATLKEFHDGKINAQCSFFKLQNLFAAHQNLLRELEVFRPESSREIEIPTPPATAERTETPNLKPLQRDQGTAFVDKVKERFEENPETYRKSLDAIEHYNGNSNQAVNVCLKMVDLFFGHADLINDFLGFISGGDAELRRRAREECAFAIDDKMGDIEVMLSRLRTSIECAEYAQGIVDPEQLRNFVAENFVGMKLMGIKKLYKDYSDEVIESLKKDPKRALPGILEGLREKERAVLITRSDALEFYKQFRLLDSKRGGVKRKSRS